MINKTLIHQIHSQIEKGTDTAPFLFLGKNPEILEQQIESIAYELLEKYHIPKNYFYKFTNLDSNIKLKDIKDFVQLWFSQPPYKIQIFFIPNISRFTTGSGNSLLKFFEEPWIHNIIFLSESSQSTILETILSRVQHIDLPSQALSKENLFYQDLIHNYIQQNNNELIAYFFQNKLEKQEYIQFLENLIIYAKKNFVYIKHLWEIQEDIYAITKNNVIAKNIVDKWILTLI